MNIKRSIIAALGFLAAALCPALAASPPVSQATVIEIVSTWECRAIYEVSAEETPEVKTADAPVVIVSGPAPFRAALDPFVAACTRPARI